MTTPVSELIAQNVLSTVQGITVTNGYTYTLNVSRRQIKGNPEAHLNTVIIQDDPEEVSAEKVYNTKEWLMRFGVGIYIMPGEKDSTPIDQYRNIVTADVEKALMIDRYRGGNALDTQIRASHSSLEELKYLALIIPVEVNYRTNELNPYQRA